MNMRNSVAQYKGMAMKLVCLMAALPALAQAAIIELDRRDFTDATAATKLQVEDFEGLPQGPIEAPVPLSNGMIYSSAAPWISAPAPGFTSLTSESPITAPRTFIVVEPGVNLFAADLFMQKDDEYQVTVTTVGGDKLTISARRGDKFESFFGVRITNDTLQSVTFTAVGGSAGPGDTGAGIGNYAFDAVAVGTYVPPTSGTSGKGKRGR